MSLALWLGLFGPGPAAHAQEGTWSVSASAGVALLQFDDVDADGRRDIAAYHELGIHIGQYPALKIAPLVELSASYRFERDLSIAPFLVFQQARTSVSHHDSVYQLSLDRRLTAVLAGVDLLYYFAPIVGGTEISLSLGLGHLWAKADQITNEVTTVKVGPGTQPQVTQDAYAVYRKSKLALRASAEVDVPFSDRLALTASVRYLFAPIGPMEGTLREFDLVRPHETSVEFNYSAVQLMLGCRISL